MKRPASPSPPHASPWRDAVSAVAASLLLLACSGGAPVGTVMSDGPPEASDAGVAPVLEEGLLDIWGASPTDIWAVGQAGTILHFDGRSWTLEDSGTEHDLIAVVGSGPDELWAVGDDVVMRGDGATWSLELEDMSEVLMGAWSGSAGEVWLAGVATDVNSGIIRHFDERGWDYAITGAATSLWAIWGSSPDTLWMGGTGSSGGPEGFLIRGGADPFDLVGYPGGSPRGIWGTSEKDVWTAAYAGDFHHFDGVDWTLVPGRTDEHFMGIGGSASDDVWAIGLEGRILHWDGTAWENIPSGTDDNLFGIWAPAADDAWIVGGAGTILHWDGESWTHDDRLDLGSPAR